MADPIRARALLLLAGVECNAFETTVNPFDEPQLPRARDPFGSAIQPSTSFILALQLNFHFVVNSPCLVQVTPAAAAPDKCSGMLKILLDYPVSLCTSLGIFAVGGAVQYLLRIALGFCSVYSNQHHNCSILSRNFVDKLIPVSLQE